MVTRVTVIYRPFNGADFRITFYVAGQVVDPNNAAVQAILTALNNVTRAVAIEIELSVINGVTDTAVVGAAYVSEDKAQFSFSDANGKAHNYKIPGPLVAIFEANKEAVDQANVQVLAYKAQILTYAKGRGGADVTTLTSAVRRENRKRLKSAPQI